MADIKNTQVGEWARSGIVVALGGIVSISGDLLHWEFDPYKAEWKTPPENLVDRFTALYAAKPRDIARFAGQWGPLRIDANGKGTDPLSQQGDEPLEWWLYLSRRAYAVLRLAKSLESGEPGLDDDWASISSAPGTDRASVARFGLGDHDRWEHSEFVRQHSGYRDAASYSKAVIGGEVSCWLRQFTVTPSVQWNERSAWHIQMNYGGKMLSAVALQLALAITYGERQFICTGCGASYKRKRDERKPNAGHGNWCPSCIKNRVRERDSERRYREKRREAVKLASQGMNLREIADRLDKTISVVRGWVNDR